MRTERTPRLVRGPRPLPHVVSARVLHDYVVRVEFDDGYVRAIDLEPVLRGEVFEPLRDKKLFDQMTVDPVLRTIVWPNGVDIAPEFLRGEEDLPGWIG